jgi:hypothetical protein
MIYMIRTKIAAREYRIVSGTVSDLSSMGIRAREALPIRVVAVFFSRYYFWIRKRTSVRLSSTTDIAAAPV